MEVETDSQVCDANVERNLLKAPAADPGRAIGSGSAKSDTKDFRGVFLDRFGEDVHVSASGANNEGSKPDLLDDPGLGAESERVLGLSGCTALGSVPLPSLRPDRMDNGRGSLGVAMDGPLTDES